jgi:hypothetical protein
MRTIFPALGALLALAACSGSDETPTAPVAEIGVGKAYSIWTPSPRETCTKEIHDSYSVVGPDGKRYPTWHPPIDPATGCTFGHEHGRDPKGSKLYGSVGPLPFGYANEVLDTWDPTGMRHEDHVGHKVEWQNDVHMGFRSDVGSALLDVRCDFLTKLHQGTHSKDAFTNNMHELIYHAKCTDGTEIHVTIMATIGTPGEFTSSCDGERHVVAGVPTPLNSPRGGGQRVIPDRPCVDQWLVAGGRESDFGLIRESWQTSNSIRRDDGHTLASFDPYYQVMLPSRYYDASQTGLVGRPVEACYWTSSGLAVRGGPCQQSTSNGAVTGLTYDDPRSRFNGVSRGVDMNSLRISNRSGPYVWYTDPFGRHGATTPFPGSIRQMIGRVDNEALEIAGPGIGFGRNYGGTGVRAPN